ncbi:MAG: hypothetical protein NC131_13470 [Roseburia sp.]|nr:hypothetical protein [Roseburia sp.]
MSSIYAKVYMKVNDEEEKHIRTCGGSLFWVDMCKKECGFGEGQRERDKFLEDHFHLNSREPGFYKVNVRLELYRKNRNTTKHLKRILHYLSEIAIDTDRNCVGQHHMVHEIPISVTKQLTSII